MGTTTAYAREGTKEIVHWPSPVQFGNSVTSTGKVIPMKNPIHSWCKKACGVHIVTATSVPSFSY